MELVGREQEIKRLTKKMTSSQSDLVAIIGRRRIGKTFLIRKVFKDDMFFQYTGLFQGTLPEHLERFATAIQPLFKNSPKINVPSSWFEAFDLLRKAIAAKKGKKKKVVFLDEFPWMATNRSRFLTAFTDFWNSFAAHRHDLLVIICGSSASWMINKVLKNKGGLHNRVTDRILLEPFNLYETELFLKKKNIKLNRPAIVELYMALGGVPFYLEQLQSGESQVQALDRIAFTKGSILQLEFDELFASLFDQSEKHQTIVKLLSNHPRGLTRKLLLTKSKLKSGGGFTNILDELEHAGFIKSNVPVGKKNNDKIYKLIDFYSLFYLKYIAPQKGKRSKGKWAQIASSPSWNSWSGLAFENICQAHVTQLKSALNILGIQSETGAWHHQGSSEMSGSQIDLLIDRTDNVINICEIKYSRTPYIITADYLKKMKLKLASFMHFTKTKKTLFPTMITANGLVDNIHSSEFIENEITLEALFEPS